MTVPAPDEPIGIVYRVLGDALLCGEPGFTFTGRPTGRAPLPADEPQRNGVGRTGGASQRKWTEEERAHAVELVTVGGLSWAKAAEQVGACKASVGDWVRRAANSSCGVLGHQER